MSDSSKSWRLQRKIATELAWLKAMGIERDNSVPLYAGQTKSSGFFKP